MVKIYRTMLFIPGNKIKWMENIDKYQVDAVILDLEDSVPMAEKKQARKNITEIITKFSELKNIDVFVRINKDINEFDKEDLKSIIKLGLDGIVLPKVEDAQEIKDLSIDIDYLEEKNGIATGQTKILPILETAKSLYFCYDIAISKRVVGITGLSSKNGDVERSIGTQWTVEGTESLYIKSKVVLAARAAGVTPIGGLWQDVHDLEGLKYSGKKNRELGFDGELILHPSNAEIMNAIYSPSEDEIKYYQNLIEKFNEAKNQGEASVMYKGSHIDLAHVQTAKEILAFANQVKNK